MDQHKNMAVSTVATAPSPAASGASLVVTAGEGARFPTGSFDYLVCPAGVTPSWAAGAATGGNFEMGRATISTDTMTLTRAQYGTTARSIVVGDQIFVPDDAKLFTDIESAIPIWTPTAAKTGNYTAVAGDLVPCDISSGSFTVTLPTAPADKSQVCVEVVNRVTALTSNSLNPFYVTAACGGSDVLFRASGPTSGIIGRGSIILQYSSSGAIWYVPGTGDLLPTGWTFGYEQIVSAVNITSTTEATGTTVIAGVAHVFDGAPVVAKFSAPAIFTGSTIGQYMVISLFEGATEVGIFGSAYVALSGGVTSTLSLQTPFIGVCRLTPSAGSHTYKVTAYVSGTGGTPQVIAGAGGTGANMAAALRLTKE